MDGSGNLVIACALKDVSLELQAGNGTYDGPGEYSFAPSNTDGTFRLSTTDGVYDANMVSGDVRTGCIVDVTTAPIGVDAPKGSAIGGTFTCTAVPHFAWISADQFAETSDGVFDFTNGTFNVSIR